MAEIPILGHELSIPSGMLPAMTLTMQKSSLTFNSFWDASGRGGGRAMKDQKDFQFLLGCFRGSELL